jgi:import receptor subunit TOM20
VSFAVRAFKAVGWLIPLVYQKVVPKPIFELLLELTSLTGEDSSSGPGGFTPGAGPTPASLSGIDDESSASPTGTSQGSGVSSGYEWEKVNGA